MRWFIQFWLSAMVVALGTLSSAHAERRVALVVGNADYRHVSKLSKPLNDANLVAKTLSELGFEILGGKAHLNLEKLDFERVVQQFGSRLQRADVGLFYYAGHGVQIRGNNYLVPIAANPTREADADFQMLDMALILKQMEGSGTRLNLVLLDACRNNPFGSRGLRASSGGLAQMQAPEGTLISFATQPGSVASDGSGGNSPYTKALAETIKQPGFGLFDAFNAVGLAVKKITGGEQQPWVSSSPIAGSFSFTERSVAAIPTVVPMATTPPPVVSAWLTAPEYQALVDRNTRERKYPKSVEARAFGNTARYRGIFEQYPDRPFSFFTHHGISPSDFAIKNRTYQKQGFALEHRHAVTINGRELVQATWSKR